MVAVKTNMAARLGFAKLHVDKSQDFWNLGIKETKAEMSGHNAAACFV